jgi:hypothetical protein
LRNQRNGTLIPSTDKAPIFPQLFEAINFRHENKSESDSFGAQIVNFSAQGKMACRDDVLFLPPRQLRERDSRFVDKTALDLPASRVAGKGSAVSRPLQFRQISSCPILRGIRLFSKADALL